MLEGKQHLLRLLQEIPLGDAEQAAVEDGVAAYEKLLIKLADVPTPAGHTQRQIGSGLVQITVSKPAVQSIVLGEMSPCISHAVSAAGAGQRKTLASCPEFHIMSRLSLLPRQGGGIPRSEDSNWSARLELCQWRRERLDKESIWDEARSTPQI
jgi:hypothetical protein